MMRNSPCASCLVAAFTILILFSASGLDAQPVSERVRIKEFFRERISNAPMVPVGLQRRAVGIDQGVFSDAPEAISFGLFDGEQVLGKVDQVKTVHGTVVVIKGTVLEPHRGWFLLVNDGPVTAGTLKVDGQTYSVQYS